MGFDLVAHRGLRTDAAGSVGDAGVCGVAARGHCISLRGPFSAPRAEMEGGLIYTPTVAFNPMSTLQAPAVLVSAWSRSRSLESVRECRRRTTFGISGDL